MTTRENAPSDADLIAAVARRASLRLDERGTARLATRAEELSEQVERLRALPLEGVEPAFVAHLPRFKLQAKRGAED